MLQIETLKTVFTNEQDLLRQVVGFYSNGQIDLDPCYSEGKFYKNTGIDPAQKFDLNPKLNCVAHASADNLPIENATIESIMFDPPFITEGNEKSAIKTRFSSFYSIQKLLAFYASALAEFKRILKPKGIIYFKCQDTTYWHKNWFTHCLIHNLARDYGFTVKDLFILTKENRMIGSHIKKQQHARKYHCYYWVLEK